MKHNRIGTDPIIAQLAAARPTDRVDSASEAQQIRAEALLHRITAQPQDNITSPSPTGANRFAKTRRAAIAALTTLAVGLGGATAATAVGIDNPIGDAIIRAFAGNIVHSEQFTASGNANGQCVIHWGVDLPPIQINDDSQSVGFSVETMPDGTMRAKNNSFIFPTEQDYAAASDMLAKAAEILASIDLSTLPGDSTPSMVMNRGTQGSLVATIGDITPSTVMNSGEEVAYTFIENDAAHNEFSAALNTEFKNQLAAAGINPDSVALSAIVGCN